MRVRVKHLFNNLTTRQRRRQADLARTPRGWRPVPIRSRLTTRGGRVRIPAQILSFAMPVSAPLGDRNATTIDRLRTTWTQVRNLRDGLLFRAVRVFSAPVRHIGHNRSPRAPRRSHVARVVAVSSSPGGGVGPGDGDPDQPDPPVSPWLHVQGLVPPSPRSSSSDLIPSGPEPEGRRCMVSGGDCR